MQVTRGSFGACRRKTEIIERPTADCSGDLLSYEGIALESRLLMLKCGHNVLELQGLTRGNRMTVFLHSCDTPNFGSR